MAKLLLNADGKVLTSNDKVLKAPETPSVMKTLLDRRKQASYLFQKYTGTSVDELISYNDTENVTDMSDMFRECKDLQEIPLLNTSNVTNMTYMFHSCKTIQTVPLFDTSNVISMNYMFQHCTNLQTIPQLDTSNVTNMTYMFSSCSSITENPQLNTSKVTNMSSTFANCGKLKKISQLDTSEVTNISYAFSYSPLLQMIDILTLDKVSSVTNMSTFVGGCRSLTKLIIRTMTVIPPLNSNSFTGCYHFDGTENPTYNPSSLKDGRIYVPDNMVETLKSATNWSAYADIIVPLSTLQEE